MQAIDLSLITAIDKLRNRPRHLTPWPNFDIGQKLDDRFTSDSYTPPTSWSLRLRGGIMGLKWRAFRLTPRLETSDCSKNPEQEDYLPSRLGTLQLGKYAYEEQMPGWLARMLEKKGEVKTDGVISALGQLLQQSSQTEYAFLCPPCNQHVSKLRREGGFCGYRNIQVLISHIIGARLPGWERFGTAVPNIPQIQYLIEQAWDKGYNPQGRTETGGIIGTRKYIGTPEVQALLRSMGFSCSVRAFRHAHGREDPVDSLLHFINTYFQNSYVGDPTAKVRSTLLSPIYLQQPGHSVTIVGFEKQKDNQIQLLVFDPSFRGSDMVTRFVRKSPLHEQSTVIKLLRSYQRGGSQLRRVSEFEILFLD